MTILPLRNMVLVRPRSEKSASDRLIVIQETKPAKPCDVLAVGPEVQDVQVGQVAIVNTITGTVIGDNLLVPETSILGTV